MRVGFIGARVHGRPDQVRALVRQLPAGTVVVSGGAPDVDTWVEEEARACGLEVEVRRPAQMTREALLARDVEIAESVDQLHTFPWVGARGTYFTASVAAKRGIPVEIHKIEPACQVFTTRWGLRGDGDVFNITRGWAFKHQGNDYWQNLPAHRYHRELVGWARASQARAGLSLLEAQNLAVKMGVPSLGEPWAPSSGLLSSGLKERDRIKGLTDDAYALTASRLGREPTTEEDEKRLAMFAEAEGLTERHWARYSEAFRLEMRESFKYAAIAWGWLLTLPRVVLACQCRDHQRCHRSLCASFLVKLGAIEGGEIAW